MPSTRAQSAQEQGKVRPVLSYFEPDLPEPEPLPVPKLDVFYSVRSVPDIPVPENQKGSTAFTTLKVSAIKLSEIVARSVVKTGDKRSFVHVEAISNKSRMVKKPRCEKSPSSIKGKAATGTKNKKVSVMTVRSRALRRFAPFPVSKQKNKDMFVFGHNPFKYRGFKPPTSEACKEVLDILLNFHFFNDGTNIPLTSDSKPLDTVDLSGPAHGSRGLTIDNFFQVILSQATDNDIALGQRDLLIEMFTYDVDGRQVRGSCPNYWKMRQCTDEELLAALKSGGLNTKRAAALKAIMALAISENCQRLGLCAEDVPTENEPGAKDFVPGLMSLEYLNGMGKEDLMKYLVSMKYVGVKTAACIASFIFGYPIFAVDTHVLHMSRALQWIPEDCDDANQACMFLDTYLPDNLKYGLHQAFWHHRSDDNKDAYCVRCNYVADDPRKPAEWETAVCPLEHLCNRNISKLTRSPAKFTKGGNVVKVISDEQEAALYATKIKKDLPSSKAINSITPERAEALGYVLVKVTRNNNFSTIEDGTAKVQWRLKEQAHKDDLITLEEAIEAELVPVKKVRARKDIPPKANNSQKNMEEFLVKQE